MKRRGQRILEESLRRVYDALPSDLFNKVEDFKAQLDHREVWTKAGEEIKKLYDENRICRGFKLTQHCPAEHMQEFIHKMSKPYRKVIKDESTYFVDRKDKFVIDERLWKDVLFGTESDADFNIPFGTPTYWDCRRRIIRRTYNL